MRHLVEGSRVGFAAGLILLASAAACRRTDRPELESGLGPITERAAEQARSRPDGSATSSADKEEASSQAQPLRASAEHPLAPAGYVLMKPKAQLDASGGNALLLIDQSEQHVVPIFVGNTEALSIGLRLQGEHYGRPLTHDLLDELLRRLGAKLSSVQIDAIRANVFIGTVVVRDRDGTLIKVDARPSDAVALAIGDKAPIFMAEQVIARAGYSIEDLDRISKQAGSKSHPDALQL